MSNNKQSSVEFLTMQLIKNGIITNEDLKQAKAMHKEEIENALQEFNDIKLSDEICYEYYNKTFDK